MIEAALHFEFMRNALFAGLLTAVLCGILGTLIVVNRLVFLSGGVAHSAYGGVGLAFFMGWPYLFGATLFALGSAMIMAAVSLTSRHRADTIIGVMWAVGMASGVLLLDLAPGYNVNLMSYLFGSILSVPSSDLVAMGVMAIVVCGFVAWFYQDLLIFSYDEEFAQVRGVPVRLLYFLMIAMVAVSIVIIVQVVGLILVIALLTIPPYIAERYTRSLAQMMLVSSLLGMFFILTGLWGAYLWDLSSGAAIIMVAGLCFFASIFLDKILQIRLKRRWLRAHGD